jgi:hypothetical protein
MAQHPVNRNTNSSTKGIAIVDNTAFDPCTAVNCTTADELTVTWLDGSTSLYHFVPGDNHIQITMVETGAAAAGLIALYNN